ncbi:lysis protein [Pseudomonas sp. SDI]|uniref:lysis system i-spanin subunit Rz n=1 Tax=Pseudomonas sp. SDI TaxID=2170734 RepID=UPI000DE63D79|nr:lysis system i-spanin subunit Rz [Pseudomonas sp. SDI]PWB34666.1 lysis protein [Pseudomonas sp. SDI]
MTWWSQILLSLVLAGAVFWTFDDMNDQLDQVRIERDQAQYERDGLREAARLAGERLAAAAALDSKHTQELTNALNQNQDLQRAVDRLDQRLRVHATCAASGKQPGTGTAGLADAGSPELTADARQAYFTLRDQLVVSRQMILGLQDHVRTFCTTQPTTGATP